MEIPGKQHQLAPSHRGREVWVGAASEISGFLCEPPL